MRCIVVIALMMAGCGKPAGYGTTSSSPGGGTTTHTLTVTAPLAPASYNIDGSENPTLTLQRGQTYNFSVNTIGHPFYIMSVQGTNIANAYNNGVTGNGTQSGTLTFVVPAGAPGTLFYDCSLHAAMTGTINVTN